MMRLKKKHERAYRAKDGLRNSNKKKHGFDCRKSEAASAHNAGRREFKQRKEKAHVLR